MKPAHSSVLAINGGSSSIRFAVYEHGETLRRMLDVTLLPIPRCYEAAGVRRHGFHGLSYESLMAELARLGDPAATKGRVILAHFGNGVSRPPCAMAKASSQSMRDARVAVAALFAQGDNANGPDSPRLQSVRQLAQEAAGHSLP